MRRKIFDVLVSAGGLIAVVVLLAAGALLMWGYSFASSSVHGQLVQQDIFFTTQGGAGLANPATAKLLDQYAGQQVLTGPQAKAYADDEIGPELSSMPYGGVYSKISCSVSGQPQERQARFSGPDCVPRAGFARTAARGVQLLDLRSGRLVGGHWELHSRRAVGPLRRVRVLACSAGPRGRADLRLGSDGFRCAYRRRRTARPNGSSPRRPPGNASSLRPRPSSYATP